MTISPGKRGVTWHGRAMARLENDIVLLAPLREDDRATLREIAVDPQIWRYVVNMIDSEESFHRWFDRLLQDQRTGQKVVFRITDKRRAATAGCMCFLNLAEADRRLEIGGSWLGTAFQGTGVNRWAKFLMLQHAFEALEAERVEFKTDVLNEQARRALRNIGATEEGVLRSYNYMPGGRRRDAIFYSVLRHEWPSVKAALLTHAKVRPATVGT